MTAFYVIKSNGSMESQVISGVFGTAEPVEGMPDHMLFHADPHLDKCSTSLSLSVAGRGTLMPMNELIKIDVAPVIANAMKANLALMLKNRWGALYDQVMGRVSSAVKAMAQTEKTRALSGIDDYMRTLPGISEFEVGVQFDSIDVRNGYYGPVTSLHGQMLLPESLTYRAPFQAEQTNDAEREERVPGIYKAMVFVPMYLPLGGNAITRRFNFSRNAEAERQEALAPQIEEMIRISIQGELADLIMPRPTSDMIDWQSAELIEAHPEQTDEDYDDDDECSNEQDDSESGNQFALTPRERPSF